MKETKKSELGFRMERREREKDMSGCWSGFKERVKIKQGKDWVGPKSREGNISFRFKLKIICL